VWHLDHDRPPRANGERASASDLPLTTDTRSGDAPRTTPPTQHLHPPSETHVRSSTLTAPRTVANPLSTWDPVGREDTRQ
jgi:hypothetical protein